MTKTKDTMTKGEIYSNLCYYDERNEFSGYDPDDVDIRVNGKCYCENCFYGRTQLAEVLIDLINLYQIQQDNG